MHKLKKDSDSYKDALQRRRKYLGKKKELKQVQNSLQPKKKKSEIEKQTPPSQDKALSKCRPLQILIEEAEISEGGSDEFPQEMSPTPPRPPPLNPPSAEVQQQTKEQTDSEEEYIPRGR